MRKNSSGSSSAEERMVKLRERAKQRAKEEKSGGVSTTVKLPKGVDFYRPKKGRRTIDVLEYKTTDPKHTETVEGMAVRRPFLRHNNIGAENERYICPKTWGKKCPVCEEYARLKEEYGWEDDRTKAARYSKRELYLMHDLEDDDSDMPKIWDISTYGFGKILDDEMEDREEEGKKGHYGLATKNGLVLNMRLKEDSSPQGKFLNVSKLDLKRRGKPADKKMVGEALKIDLDACLIEKSYDELKAIFLELDEDEKNGKDKGKGKKNKGKVDKSKGKQKGKKQKCPAKAGRFAKDLDQLAECDTCDLWSDCKAATQ